MSVIANTAYDIQSRWKSRLGGSFGNASAKRASSVARALLLLRGAGLALAQLPAMTAAYGGVAKTETGDAATLINMAQRLGGALGAVLTVIALEQGPRSAAEPSYGSAFGLLIAFAAGSVVTARRLKRRAAPDRH